MRFDLSRVPDRAVITGLRVSVVLTRPPQSAPRLAILYSAKDDWDPGQLTSDTAELVPRTAPVSGDLGPPRNGRGDYAVDVGLYRPLWAADLADHAITLGCVPTTPGDQ